MHGFFGTYGQSVSWDLTNYGHLLQRSIHCGSLQVEQRTLDKFVDYKPFVETSSYVYALEGIVFEPTTDLALLYEQYGENFMRVLRGTFSGFLYDKQKDILLVFTDQIGSKMLFWHIDANRICFSSDLLILCQSTRQHTIDWTFANELLTAGYSHNSKTIVNGIHRLMAGECLRIAKGQAEVVNYFRFSNKPIRQSRQQRIETIDHLFRQAVRRVIKVNEQLHLRHFFPLSGGLDSRMVQWVTANEAKQPIVNFTYSQEGHYDHLVAQQIAKYLHHEWIFESLNGGDYLANIDDLVASTNMLLNYNGPSEIANFIKHHSWEDVGIVLTGVNGDNILSAEIDSKHEIDRLYSLSLGCNLLGSPLVLQEVTESYSPFMDIDFLEYVLSIPTCWRRNYRIYDQWILTYYPSAAQWHHKYIHIGQRPWMILLFGRYLPLRTLLKRTKQWGLKHLLGIDTYRLEKGDSMNPYDTWYKENAALRDKLDNYFNIHIGLLDENKPLQQLTTKIYHNGVVYEKCKVLTLLSAMTLVTKYANRL